MEKKQNAWICVAIIAVAIIGYMFIPSSRTEWNTLFYKVQKADDATSYTTRKKVEDSCRSMIASYESDRLTYEQYKDSESAEKQSWAEQAKMRANKTASTYITIMFWITPLCGTGMYRVIYETNWTILNRRK